jgi:peptide deformylase
MPILRQIAQIGHPVLRSENVCVALPLNTQLETIVADMFVTLAESGGVGIAAPQVYENLRIVIIASRPTPRYPDAPLMEPTLMINPELLWLSEQRDTGWEGCLSIPGLRGRVPRSTSIRVKYFIRDGEERIAEFSDFPARIFQHEYDHLLGILFTDRLADTRDLYSESEYLRTTR